MEDRPPEIPPTPDNPWSVPPPPPQFPPTSAYGGGQPGWATPPPPGPASPQGPQRPARPGRGVGVLVAVALTAGLVGGGAGAAVTYGVTDDDTPTVSSLTSKPVTGTKTSNNAPAGSVEQVASKVLPSVVSIDVRGTAPSRGLMDLGGDTGPDQIVGSGSGVVISNDGLILTNSHVAENGELSVTFKDGRTVKAKMIKADKSSDLAVIKAQGISDATPIAFGSSSDLVVGQQVVAVGSPLGLSGTVTSGIVSARNRPVVTTQGVGSGDDGSVIDAIQTDAPINPGNSGGALVDMSGRLVGITSAIASLGSSLGGPSGSIGLGFAIPIDQARVIAAKLAKGETVAHPLMGVQVTGSPRPTQRGALIDQVTDGGAAEKAGLKKGDLIIQLDERLIDTSDALVAGVRSKQPGDKVTVTYLRGDETRKVDVVLGSDAKVTSS